MTGASSTSPVIWSAGRCGSDPAPRARVARRDAPAARRERQMRVVAASSEQVRLLELG
jgi:hypothetical protein